MTCHEARELFSERIDGRLGADERARLDAHLAGCDDCRAEWARFEAVVSLARTAEPARAPAGFVDRVLEAARPVPWPVRLLRHAFTPIRIKLPLEVAALLLIGGLAVMMFQRSPEMQRMARPEHALRDTATAPATPPASPVAPPPSAADVSAPSSNAPAVAPEAPPSSTPPTDVAAPRSDTAPATPQPVPSRPPAVMQELRRETTDSARRESVAKSAAPRAAEPLVARARPPAPDVSIAVTVADRTTALIGLAEILVRLGAREYGRRAEDRVDDIDVAVPRDAYDAFIRDVSRLGGFLTERHSPELPASVSISLRIAH